MILLGNILYIFFNKLTQANTKNKYFDVITTSFETEEHVTIKSKTFWFQISLSLDI